MSEKFDRNKIRGAKLNSLRQVREDANKKDVKLLSGGSDGRVNFLQVEEGRNEFRIMPPHNPEDSTYYALRTAMLECEVPIFKDGEDTGKTEVKNKKIFIATQHGNDALRKLAKDPIELYIKYVGEQANLIDGRDERQSFLNPIRGWRAKDGKWNWGIMPSTSYVCYAIKGGELGRFELWESWLKKLDKIVASIEEEEREPLDYDPFSDPDEGYPITITKEKNEKGKWEYTIDRVNPRKRQTWDEFCEENRVTDAQLDDLMSKESLKELYVDTYSKRDFDLAISGLRMFDKKHKYNIFDDKEFLKELDEIEKIVPEDKSSDDKKIEQEFKKVDSNVDLWPKIKCKKYLKAYIIENYGDDGEDYLQQVDVMDIDGLRNWCSYAEAGEELPLPDEDESDSSEPETDDPQIDAPEGVEDVSSEDEELSRVISRRRRRG